MVELLYSRPDLRTDLAPHPCPVALNVFSESGLRHPILAHRHKAEASSTHAVCSLHLDGLHVSASRSILQVHCMSCSG